MARPRKPLEERSELFGPGKSPVMFDMIIPGLGVGSGRSTDRFKCSSETNVLEEYRKRLEMIEDLARRFQFEILRARLSGLFTTTRMWEVKQREGEAGLLALKQDAEKAAEMPSPPALLVNLVDAQLRTTAARDKTKSRKMVKRFIEYVGGPAVATPDHLTTDNTSAFLESLTCARKNKGDPARGSTRNRYRAALMSLCVYLTNQGYLVRNPMAKQVARYDEGDSRIPQLAAEEYQAYFRHMTRLHPHLVPFFRVLAHTGVDVGEARALNVRDAHLDRKVPRIETRRTKTRKSKVRQPPFPPVFAPELRNHIKRHRLRLGDKLFGMFTISAIEGAHDEVRQLIHRGLRMRDGTKRDEREVLRLKDFRHVSAVAWARANTPLHIIQKWLGHSTITLTAVYTNFYPTDDEDAPFVELATATLVGKPARPAVPLA